MQKNNNIVVVGSLNIDLVTSSTRFPIEGETIIGDKFEKYPGGKGANQAVAAARLGGRVNIIGCIGDDLYGHQIKNHLKNENVGINSIFTAKNISTGVAQISTAKKQNKITVIPGANYHLNTLMIRESKELIKQADILLIQLEIPLGVIAETIKIAVTYGVPVILNPAPAINLPKSLFSGVSFITPNDVELAHLTETRLINHNDYRHSINELHSNGVDNVIVTRGEKGVFFSDNESIKHIKRNQVNVLDTTGAGDTFNGALAVSLANGKHLDEAVEFANIAAALSTTKAGAQSGMPCNNDIEIYKEMRAL